MTRRGRWGPGEGGGGWGRGERVDGVVEAGGRFEVGGGAAVAADLFGRPSDWLARWWGWKAMGVGVRGEGEGEGCDRVSFRLVRRHHQTRGRRRGRKRQWAGRERRPLSQERIECK